MAPRTPRPDVEGCATARNGGRATTLASRVGPRDTPRVSAPLPTITARNAAGRVTLMRAADVDLLLAPLVSPALRAAVVERVRAAGLDQVRAHAAVVATLAGEQAPRDVAAWTPVEVLRDGAALVSLWPLDAPPAEVLAWLAAQAPDAGAAAATGDRIRAWLGSADRGADDPSPLDVALAARAWLAAQGIEADRARKFVALDAGPAHHALVGGMRDLPKSRRKAVAAPTRDGWAEILHPHRQLGLRLDVHDLPVRLVEAIRTWRGWQGLRHWAGLQVLLTDAGRTGRIRWTLDGHLAALGYSADARGDPAVRATVAGEVEALTRLEVSVYHPDGTLRARGSVLAVTQRGERLRGSEWTLEGLELVVHPVLYEGVRRADGTLGKLWAPAPAELARIHHGRHPHALILGLILPIRWRWDTAAGADHVALTGATLLETAGIARSAHDPGRAWETLDRNLRVLQRAGGLGHWTWAPGGEHTLSGICRLYPAQWQRERLVHGIAPTEPPPPPAIVAAGEGGPLPVLTGGEFRTWRTARGWTQTETAQRLGVGERTVRLAESTPDVPLGNALRAALGRARG